MSFQGIQGAGLKDELAQLQDARERGVRELGTLAVEMYGANGIDLDVLSYRARELAVVDERIRDLEARLRLATT